MPKSLRISQEEPHTKVSASPVEDVCAIVIDASEMLNRRLMIGKLPERGTM